MFLRYTHLGVGHPVALRRIVRGCFFPNMESTTPVNLEVMVMDQSGSGEGHEEGDDLDDEQMDSDHEQMDSDDEQMDLDDDQVGEVSEDKHDGIGEEELEDDEEPDDQFDEEIEVSDDLSF